MEVVTVRSDAEKKAQKKYLDQFVKLELRMLPEEKAAVQAHVAARDEKMAGFLARAIKETMARDNEKTPPN